MTRPREGPISGLGIPLVEGERPIYGRATEAEAYERVLTFRRLLEERWPREKGESEEDWYRRAYAAFARGLWDPSRKRDLPHYSTAVVPGLEERPREEDLSGLARAGERRERRDPGEVREAARRALAGED